MNRVPMLSVLLAIACVSSSPLHAQQRAPTAPAPTAAQLQTENARLTAENARLTAEIGRLTAELARATPLTTAPPVAKAAIDKGKFDKVYAAGKAIEQAAIGDISRREWDGLMRTFKTEASIASDKSTSPEENHLSAEYSIAALQFSAWVVMTDPAKKAEYWTKATDKLDTANAVYLAK